MKDLLGMSREEFNNFMNSFDTVVTDCDGVLWMGMDEIPGAVKVMTKFKEMGKKIFYVTNNSTKTRVGFLDKFKKLGFNTNASEVICTSYLAAQYISDHADTNKKVYVIGSEGLAAELQTAGLKCFGIGPDPLGMDIGEFTSKFSIEQDVGAVVVGFDEHFSYPKMMKAASYLYNKSTVFVGTNTDEQFPLKKAGVVMPGTGALVRAVETCANRKAFVVGKPEAYLREVLMKEENITPSRTLMIGDRCNTDILLGKRCGFQTLMVLSGVTSLEEVHEWQQSKDPALTQLVPDFYSETLGLLHSKIQ
ncbi:unnamed protein product [Bemisia tabaci]|uniref:Phosphoglycolate phosphatase n=1 Tax=Bemisia tabaci TaxID=7038 RepID=A0A9P0A3B6_BEMTA|nr:PREDICTED: glycerol-3-phosphate phosphatase [Bemisia tabaci]CAH0385460.1 unnamed protein product [Bemisia tabaci]